MKGSLSAAAASGRLSAREISPLAKAIKLLGAGSAGALMRPNTWRSVLALVVEATGASGGQLLLNGSDNRFSVDWSREALGESVWRAARRLRPSAAGTSPAEARPAGAWQLQAASSEIFVPDLGEAPPPGRVTVAGCSIQAGERAIGELILVKAAEGEFGGEEMVLIEAMCALMALTAEAGAARRGGAATFLQESFDPVLLTDRGGRILEANAQASQFFGYSSEVLKTMTIQELHAYSGEVPAPERVAETTSTFVSAVYPHNGPARQVEVYARRSGEAGRYQWQWLYHDISRLIGLEETQQDLTAMLVHDLQNPLSNVITSLMLIRTDLTREDNEEVLPMLDVAIRSSNHLLILIHSLLDISRLEAGQALGRQEAVALATLLDEVYDLEHPVFEQREVRFVRELEPGLREVFVRPDMIRRVLVNLIENALKFGSERQQITVTASNEGKTVVVSVCDQGQGVPGSYRETIFEKFERVKGESESTGLGLGLAFCRLAVEAHGGRIWVDDAPGGGARFSFSLPASQGK